MFSFKKKKEAPKKLELIINKQTLRAEYRCPYCNCLLAEDNPRLIQKPKIEQCPYCKCEVE